MKKNFFLVLSLVAGLMFVSCKTQESDYKKAYEKAKAQETAQQTAPQPAETEANVVAPLVDKPATDTPVVDNVDNVQVRQEKVSVVSGSGLKNYSVVVGSFSLKANADGLQQKLREAGYDAQLVKNDERNMYRVVATTFDNKADAAASRNEFRAQYPDAWLLYNAQ